MPIRATRAISYSLCNSCNLKTFRVNACNSCNSCQFVQLAQSRAIRATRAISCNARKLVQTRLVEVVLRCGAPQKKVRRGSIRERCKYERCGVQFEDGIEQLCSVESGFAALPWNPGSRLCHGNPGFVFSHGIWVLCFAIGPGAGRGWHSF